MNSKISRQGVKTPFKFGLIGRTIRPGRAWSSFGRGLTVLLLAALLAAPLSLSAAGPAAAAGPRCYVNDDAGGANSGTSWGDAYTDLQAALADTGCTEIWVAAGTYKPTTGGNRGFSFVLKNGVAIYGGFAGTETQLGQRDWAANVTTLSGDLNGDDVGFTNNGENSRIVVRGESGTNNTAVLDGFTIRGGNADACSDCQGGGMYNNNSSPTLANLTFTFNTASTSGGGMANYNSSNPTLTNVTFAGNTTADGYSGGGMYNYNSNPTLTDVTFSVNTATAGGGMSNYNSSPTLTDVTFGGNSADSYGGGMQNYYSNPTLTDVTFGGNTANEWGGGMRNGASSPVLTNVTFDTNMAGANGGGMENDGTGSNPALTNVTFNGNMAIQGGGMYNSEGSPVLTNVTFNGNTATEGGAGMANIDGSPTLTNVTFSGNIADAPDPQVSAGGGMANYNTYSSRSPTLTNVTFSSNSADYGGGMLNYFHSSPILTNVTFGGNTALNGGGIYNDWYSSPTINDVILWGDGTEVSSARYSAPIIKDSVVQSGCPSGASCTNIITGDPKLGPLQNNGGSTKTRALGAGSSAVDAGGVNSTCANTDQRGMARPQGAHCDIGSYEANVTLTLRSVGTQDGWILESTETSNQGGTMNNTATTFNLGDDATDRQYRALLSFYTAPLPDTAVITKVTLKIKYQGVTGTNPFATHGVLYVDIRKGVFGGNATLQLGDFQAVASKTAVGTIPNTPSGGWYSKVWTSGIFPYINKVGATQIRLRFQTDDNDDLGADFLRFYSGNASAVSDRPLLIVEYYVP